MTRVFLVLLVFLCFSCNTKQKTSKNENVASSLIGAGMDQELQIKAKLLSIQEAAKKFKVLAIVQNETGITSFSKGDTVSLYPNFVRREGQRAEMKSSENQQMASLQGLQEGNIFSATIKIRGEGNNRHGLIMEWKK